VRNKTVTCGDKKILQTNKCTIMSLKRYLLLQYITIIKINAAFHPDEVSKSSMCLAAMVRRVHLFLVSCVIQYGRWRSVALLKPLKILKKTQILMFNRWHQTIVGQEWWLIGLVRHNKQSPNDITPSRWYFNFRTGPKDTFHLFGRHFRKAC